MTKPQSEGVERTPMNNGARPPLSRDGRPPHEETQGPAAWTWASVVPGALELAGGRGPDTPRRDSWEQPKRHVRSGCCSDHAGPGSCQRGQSRDG